MNTGLKDRVALVAASSQGIGKAVAKALAAEGCKIALCARNESALKQVADELRAQYGSETYYEALDVTNPDAVASFVENVGAKFGRLDICVANAGGPPAKGFLALTTEDWRRAFELNLLATISFARAALPWMQKNNWGRFVTITSVSVKQPIADLILSNTIRTGVVGLVRSLANDFGKFGITVNNVGPGYTETDRLKDLASTRAQNAGVTVDEMYKRWAVDTATGKIAQPEEVAAAVVYLASDLAGSTTGQTILVDNGSYRGL